MCLSWIPWNLKLSTWFESSMMRLKHKICCFHVAGNTMFFFFFFTAFSQILFPFISQSCDPTQRCIPSSSNPILVKSVNSRPIAHLNSFVPHSTIYEIAFQRPFLPPLTSTASSRQCTITSCHLPLWLIIFITHINHSLSGQARSDLWLATGNM